MSLSQETPPEVIEPELREYLSRRFIDIDNLFARAPKFPERKQMPYKPQFGDQHYFGDPDLHLYDPVINTRGWWGFREILPTTDPRTGEWQLQSVKAILDLIFLVGLEEAIILKDTVQNVLNGNTILNYDSALPIDPLANIVFDLAAGTITVGVDGWYTINGYAAGVGSTNQAFYGLFIDLNAGASQFILGSAQWDNNNPGLIFSGSIKVPLSAGDVISLTVFASGGTFNVSSVSLSVEMEGFV